MGRLVRSSSVGDSTDFVGRVKPFRPRIIATAAATTGPDNRPVVQNKPIFTLSSPPRDGLVRDNSRGENFADACASCKKEIPEDRERYMYGYLQAFCSTICRDNQIALDEAFNPPSSSRGGQISANFITKKLLKIKFHR